MASPMQVVNGAGSMASNVVPIALDYDDKTYAVTVAPAIVDKGATICFTCSKGSVRVVFVSPFGDNGPEMLESDQRQLTVGGLYHFRCFFKANSYAQEVASPTGGILDVQPHRP